jgi:hypothetical protein
MLQRTDSVCKHCDANLDGGDAYKYFLVQCKEDIKTALHYANLYGWSAINGLHYDRRIVNVNERFTQCPECNVKDYF